MPKHTLRVGVAAGAPALDAVVEGNPPEIEPSSHTGADIHTRHSMRKESAVGDLHRGELSHSDIMTSIVDVHQKQYLIHRLQMVSGPEAAQIRKKHQRIINQSRPPPRLNPCREMVVYQPRQPPSSFFYKVPTSSTIYNVVNSFKRTFFTNPFHRAPDAPYTCPFFYWKRCGRCHQFRFAAHCDAWPVEHAWVTTNGDSIRMEQVYHDLYCTPRQQLVRSNL
ncbi:hypothetical protein C8J57DRAFT_1537963 [Mycena rebaudengoi]|nr:hypothetical protein C8J57DRAFT_1537963 [Mycena rebaudengoi]